MKNIRNGASDDTSWKRLSLSAPVDTATRRPRYLERGIVLANSLTLDDVSRLLNLVITVAEESECTYSEAINKLAERIRPLQSSQPDRAALAEFMSRSRKVRLKRNALIGAPIFRDPSFDMLLELFATDQLGQKISVTSLCYASGVPQSTALRHLNQLERYGLVVREGDLEDNRRCYVRPTDKTISGLEIVFDQWLAAWVHLMRRTTLCPSAC